MQHQVPMWIFISLALCTVALADNAAQDDIDYTSKNTLLFGKISTYYFVCLGAFALVITLILAASIYHKSYYARQEHRRRSSYEAAQNKAMRRLSLSREQMKS